MPRWHRPARVRLALVVLVGVAIALVPDPARATTPATSGSESPPVPPTAVTTAAPDFATARWGDPWDFSNPDDLVLDAGPTMGLESPAIRDGYLSFGMSGLGYLSPLWGGYPGALFLGREGRAPQNRIDAGRYTRLSVSMHSDRDVEAGIHWFGGPQGDTMGGMPFTVRSGWHTYDLLLQNQAYGLPQPWSGQISGLRLALSPRAPARLTVDWLRLYAATPGPGTPAGALWDVNDVAADNTADRPGWGRVPEGGLAALPPGTYWLVVGGQHTGPVVVRRPASPVVLDPDEVGGAEYAADDPWDFNGPHDATEVGGSTVLGWGSRLTARNTSNDPFAWMRLGAGHVDTHRFHRLTVRSGYEGPFDLRDVPGGGSMARVVWRAADNPGSVQQTNDIVTYSGTRTVTIDLDAPDVHEPEAPPVRAWSAAPVSGLRWDPNEDRGSRTWWLERLALRADDEAGTSYDVRWLDAGYAPGSTVTIHRQDDAAGSNRQVVRAGLVQRPGTNVFRWDTGGTPPGSYYVAITVSGPAGTATAVSSGPVRVLGGALAGQAPSPATPVARDLGDACPQSRVPEDGYGDVAAGGVHEPSIDCIAWWAVTQPVHGYGPAGQVTRGQMASFLKRTIENTGGSLPAGGATFADVRGDTHESAIAALARAGVVTGYPDGTYRPDVPVDRAQMATFLVRAAEQRSGRPLVEAADYFGDDGDQVHQGAINKAAAAGVAGGTAEGRYSPSGVVRRDQMASFLARTLDLLVADGQGAAPVR